MVLPYDDNYQSPIHSFSVAMLPYDDNYRNPIHLLSPAEPPDDDNFRIAIQVVFLWLTRPRKKDLWKTPQWPRPGSARNCSRFT